MAASHELFKTTDQAIRSFPDYLDPVVLRDYIKIILFCLVHRTLLKLWCCV